MIELVESFEVLEIYEGYDEYISKKWEREVSRIRLTKRIRPTWLTRPTNLTLESYQQCDFTILYGFWTRAWDQEVGIILDPLEHP